MDIAAGRLTRQDYLVELNNFIMSSNSVIRRFTEDIGWASPPASNTNMIHLLAEVQSQLMKTPEPEGINEYSEEPLLPSAASSPSIFSVRIDTETQRNLLLPYKKNALPDLRPPPTSAGELTANFTREERLTLYEYTLKNAAPVAVPSELLPVEVANSESQPKELSELELKKAMRDFKRRRQAYRTKVSTKNKSQIEITREIIHSMMGLFGGDEPVLPGTPNVSAPTCSPDGGSDSHSLDKQARSAASTHNLDINSKRVRDVRYSKWQVHRMKRKEQESHKSRNSDDTLKDEEYSNTCSEQGLYSLKYEKKFRTIDMKDNIKNEGNEGDWPYDKYQSRHKNKHTSRKSNQSRERKRMKSGSESEARHYEYREVKRDREGCVIEKHEDMRGHYRELSSGNSQKRERSKRDHKHEHHSSRENSKGSRNNESKGC